MKQFQVMLKDKSGVRALVNGSTIDATYFANNDICTKDAGYDTLTAAKRIATIATKKLIADEEAKARAMTDAELKEAVKSDDIVEIGAVSTDELIAENAKYEAEQAAAAKADKKALTKALMQKHYPAQEKAIEAEYGEANPKIADLTQDEAIALLMGGDSAEALAIKPAKSKTVRKPKARKSPLDLTEKQVFFLDNMRKDDFYEHGLDSILWIDILTDTLSSLGMNPMTTGAMVSTLREKGIISVGETQREKKHLKVFNLTELGKEAMVKYGLDK